MNHVFLKNNKIFCCHCGAGHPLTPCTLDDFQEKVKGFELLHKSCPPAWEPPMVNYTLPTRERAYWWLLNGEVGSSSLAMWYTFMGDKIVKLDHPYDPDDFSRCYKLLQVMPEWKKKMELLRPLSQTWSNLVDNWPQLTDMYEWSLKESRGNPEEIGFYHLIQKVIYQTESKVL